MQKSKVGKCSNCGKVIYFVTCKNGRKIVVNGKDWMNHKLVTHGCRHKILGEKKKINGEYKYITRTGV